MMQAWNQLKFGSAFLKIVKDPRQTEAVFDIADLGLKQKDPAHLEPMIEHAMSFPEFKKLYEEKYIAPPVDLSKLCSMPIGTLGHEYGWHMVRQKLDPNFYRPVKPTEPALYIALRARQTHDIWHVLTGYDTSVRDELALQGFTFAQVRSGVSLTLLSAGWLHYLKTNPRSIYDVTNAVFEGFERGKRAAFLLAFPWEKMWEMPLRDAQVLAGLR